MNSQSERINNLLINSTFNFTVPVPPTYITFQLVNILLIVVTKLYRILLAFLSWAFFFNDEHFE